MRCRREAPVAARDAMGLVYVEMGVAREGGPEQTVRFLIDSGAAYSVLPWRVWRALGLKPKRRLEFTLADGTIIRRRLAHRGAERLQACRRRARILAQDHGQPLPLGEQARLLAGQLAPDDGEHVGRDARVELPRALERRHHVLLEERAHGVEQLAHAGPVLHAHVSVSESSSSSISATRRPRLASSTLRAPSTKLRACITQMIAHFQFPNTSHQRAAAGSTGAPPARA